VRVDHARHDRRPGAVDHLVAWLGLGAAAHLHGLGAVPPDDDVGGHRRRPGAVEDLPVHERLRALVNVNPALGYYPALPVFGICDGKTLQAGPLNGVVGSPNDYGWSPGNRAEAQMRWITKAASPEELAKALGPTVLEAELDLGDIEHALVGLIARPAPKTDAAANAEGAAAASSSDVAVVVVGLTEEQETESRDKATLVLPGAQDALIEAVAAAAPRTVVVVNSATLVLMPWADRVDAILAVGLPGQEGGAAVADVLLGIMTGRLQGRGEAHELD
jgi:hypothetical protein